ncbi:helix-turn-helix domain-containing protein [Cellulosilyticum ruminicola]|uniref:helix-turn-helix domain-containing protein n=1 Tax=Cellulosilyticum ruminicola TaxID=425254 RepID=UPI0006D001FC|nr:AraC family transcriptional regulator [Cellulosilyticum ruminicola]
MLKEKNEKLEGFETYSRINLIELLITLGRITLKRKNNYLEFPSSLHKKISEVTAFINEHFMDDITLSLVAKRFYMNPYYLCRTFKEVTGSNFTQYLNTVRIRASEELLLTTNLSILEIATATGYTNSTHFGRVFKQTFGISPLQYRKLHAKADSAFY